MKTKFSAKYLESYIVEIFGRQDVKDPLLLKNLSQKTKFKLKKLGNALQSEYKDIRAHLQELFEKYATEEEMPVEQLELPLEGQEKKASSGKAQKRIPEDKKEAFLKEAGELENMLIEIEHAPFEEKDFIDKETGDIVAGGIYYNCIELVLGWEQAEEPKLTESAAELT